MCEEKYKNTSELVDMIDKLMESGSGRVSILAVDGDENAIQVNTVNSTECNSELGACCQPTELIDD